MGAEDADALRMDLAVGPSSAPLVPEPSPATLEAAWVALRDDLCAERPGRRPWAWWTFEADEAMPAADEELARLLELDEMDVVELQPVVALGLDVLQLAPFSGSIPPALREANVVRAARGEVPLPTPVVGASDCCRQLQRLHALLGTHTYTDQDDQ
jgi:hypothetical protein